MRLRSDEYVEVTPSDLQTDRAGGCLTALAPILWAT